MRGSAEYFGPLGLFECFDVLVVLLSVWNFGEVIPGFRLTSFVVGVWDVLELKLEELVSVVGGGEESVGGCGSH